MTPDLNARFDALPQPHPVLQRLTLREGDRDDYRALSRHHYKAALPRTSIRIFALDDPDPPPHERWRHASRSGVGEPRKPKAVAVLIESLPCLSCRMRDLATDRRYASCRGKMTRSALLNRELRCISRVIVDPRYRGLGLAGRLVRHALDTAQTAYTEAIAAMGRVQPFFERAGMTAYRRPRLETDARIQAVLARAGLGAAALADLDGAMARVDELDPETRDWVVAELRNWNRQSCGRSRIRKHDPRSHLDLARTRLGAPPVYYLRRNPIALRNNPGDPNDPSDD
ncbi:MAG: GNAT family N-acetyltransferase [Planctomycetota bacterium]